MGDNAVVLITGANTGLGYQIVRALYTSDKTYTILVGGRSLSKAEQACRDLATESPSALSTARPFQIDIEDDVSIQNALKHVQEVHGKVDVLVNNAGGQFDPLLTQGKLNEREMWQKSWAVNTVGTQIMTSSFVPLLLQSSNPRLLFIASGTSSLAVTENPNAPINAVPEKGWPKRTGAGVANIPAYRSAKAGMNMMMREWDRILLHDGVKVWCISPGFLATGLGGDSAANKKNGATDPAVAGDFVRTVVEGQRDGDVGKVITKDGIQPW